MATWSQRFPSFEDPRAAEFSGNTQQFRLVDENRFVSDEYKLSRLKEALQGSSAEDIMADMFDGSGAYTAAWTELLIKERCLVVLIAIFPCRRDSQSQTYHL
eukprot:scpid95756/ scgid12441/ 